jgi:NACalpha-BTF3-like transcription factor
MYSDFHLYQAFYQAEDFMELHRYFFKLSLITRGDIATLDEYDEEDIEWETDDVGPAEKSGGGAKSDNEALETLEGLQAENARLKSQVKALVARVTELEAIVQNKGLDSVNVSLDSITFANEAHSYPMATGEAPAIEQNLAETFESLIDSGKGTIQVPLVVTAATTSSTSSEATLVKDLDVALLVEELEVSRDEAEALLRKHHGSVQKALAAVIADPTNLAASPSAQESAVKSNESDAVMVDIKPILSQTVTSETLLAKGEPPPAVTLDDDEDEDDGWEV